MQKRFAKQKSIGLFDESTEYLPHLGPKWSTLNKKQQDRLDAIMAAYAGCIDNLD